MVCHNQSDYKIGVIYFFRGTYIGIGPLAEDVDRTVGHLPHQSVAL